MMNPIPGSGPDKIWIQPSILSKQIIRSSQRIQFWVLAPTKSSTKSEPVYKIECDTIDIYYVFRLSPELTLFNP